jgi:putative redox protein
MGPVIVRAANAFRNEITAGHHTLVADEPADAGGTDAGPTPYDFLSAALGTCTSMTLHFIAKRDGIPLDGVEINVTNDRMYARDCADCLTHSGYIHKFTVRIKLEGNLTEDQRQKLLAIAKRCPVYKTLTNEIRIDEELVG